MKKKYEIMAIFSNELNEADVEKHIESSIKKKLTEAGGNITFEDYWGAKGFAYIIKKQKWGYYFVAQFELSSEKIAELRKEWNIDKTFLRFLVSLVAEKDPAPRKFADIQAEYKALEKKVQKEDPESEKKEEKERKSTREKLTTVGDEVKKTSQTESSKPLKQETKSVQKKQEKEEKKKDVSVDKKLNDIIRDSSLDL